MKKFTIPCDFGEKKSPFDVYIGKATPHKHPMYFQSLWLSKERGGIIPQEVMKSFEKLRDLALKNDQDFEDLCMYALESAAEEKGRGLITKEINGKKMNIDKLYLFKSFKTYAFGKTFFEGHRKYQQVFSRHETSYVSFELSFYNRLEGWEDWSANLEFVCHKLPFKEGDKEVFRVKNTDTEVKKDTAIRSVTNGWGNAEKPYWNYGAYQIEAFIDGKNVAKQLFYVNDFGGPVNNIDKILNVKSLKFFEGPSEGVPEKERKYMDSFQTDESRYIFWELDFENKFPESSWYIEAQAKVFTPSFELMAEFKSLKLVPKAQQETTAIAGWGSMQTGTWAKGDYIVKLFVMDQEAASANFTVT